MRFRQRSDDDFADEIRSHIELETDRLIAAGMTPDAARHAARRAFGNVTHAREGFHRARGSVLLEQLMQDVRYAGRAMRRSPAFSLVAIVCLTIGISVNTTAFSVLNALLFRSFPGVERQQQLVTVLIGHEASWGRASGASASLPEWEALRAGLPSLSGVAAWSNLPLSARIQRDSPTSARHASTYEPHAVHGALVSDNFFDVLGTRPALGRFIHGGEGAGDIDGVVVVSHRYWRRTLGARPDAIGSTMVIGTRSFTVIGVTPEGFFGLYPGEIIDPDLGAPELFVPLAAARALRSETAVSSTVKPIDDRWLQVFGRMKPGATMAEVVAQANGVASNIAAMYPRERKSAFAEIGSGGSRSKDAAELRTGMLFVMSVPAIILLVACANLANQLLARGIQRSREIAVRISLGATRARVVRQLLAESGMLACAACILGLILTRWLLDGLGVWYLAIPFRVPIDARVGVFTLILAFVTVMLFGLAPALRVTRTDLVTALKEGAPGTGQRRSRTRSALVIVQIAASLALIAVASVFVRTAQTPPSAALRAIAGHEAILAVNLDLLGLTNTEGRAYQQRVMDRLRALPGVSDVGMAPFNMFDMISGRVMYRPGTAPERRREFDLAEVSGDWLQATGVTARRGRAFTAAEMGGTPNVLLVDDEFARRMWRGADPIGQTLQIDYDSLSTSVTVVGVIPTRREVAYREAEGVAIIPAGNRYSPRVYFFVRTNGPAAEMIAHLQRAARSVDTRVPILWARTLEDVAARENAPLTMVASGLSTLGWVALALATLGLFGVMSFIVAQRRYEIGVRMALGARRVDVTWMVLRQALRLGVTGVAIGTLLSLAVVTALRAIVHGVKPLSLSAFLEVSIIMTLVAAVSSFIPARRAASIDPMEALRAE